MATNIDGFSARSAENFRHFEKEQAGNRVLFFPYGNHNSEHPSRLVGLWLSHEIVKPSIEAAHYIPDIGCKRALRQSGAYFDLGTVWLGLAADVSDEQVAAATITVPSFLIDQYSYLAIDDGQPLVEELEDRFDVKIEQS